MRTRPAKILIDGCPMNRESGSVDELRIEIWDFLFRAKEPKSVSEISDQIDQETEIVRSAVNHEWFTIVDDMVSISQTTEGS